MSTEFKFTVSARRKYPALRIDKDGNLEFLAPSGFSLSAAEKLVARNGELIEKLKLRHARISQKRLAFGEGMKVYWYGKEKPVIFTRAARAVADDGIFVPNGNEEKIRANLEILYKNEARRYLPERTMYLANLFGITVKSVSIGSAVSRWGSCKRDGAIRYSWRLIQCESDLIDYIIIHELAHRKEFDHSLRFWSEVEKMLPNSETYKTKLRIFSQKNGLL